ncbi:MAG: hypothetical protein EZS28_015786 [Streblomastix strix]|uniref:Uncharacterized protein n=1 Tax=Streblomastix strix TaxID=222440 RepID=A0A5J4W2D2_9EUKA|nr:MAG: hypothetical protein EZS28_015786 [Streblomastix strix]
MNFVLFNDQEADDQVYEINLITKKQKEDCDTEFGYNGRIISSAAIEDSKLDQEVEKLGSDPKVFYESFHNSYFGYTAVLIVIQDRFYYFEREDEEDDDDEDEDDEDEDDEDQDDEDQDDGYKDQDEDCYKDQEDQDDYGYKDQEDDIEDDSYGDKENYRKGDYY